MIVRVLAIAASLYSVPALAQQRSAPAASIQAGAYPAQRAQVQRRVNMAGEWMQGKLMPAQTLLSVTPLQEISSKHIEVGESYRFATVGDVVENGFVVIPRGSPVTGVVTWKTGRAIGGKSGKFDIAFKSVQVNGRDVPLTGKHHQEGRGNSVGALLGSMVVTGRSAVMEVGQQASAFTAEPVPY